MKDFDKVQKDLEKSGKAGVIRELAESPEAKYLGSMVDKEQLEYALESGDQAQLQSLMSSILGSPEGKTLVEKLSKEF